ncbi:MAG: amidohydrolase [Actinomycetota bacterium]
MRWRIAGTTALVAGLVLAACMASTPAPSSSSDGAAIAEAPDATDSPGDADAAEIDDGAPAAIPPEGVPPVGIAIVNANVWTGDEAGSRAEAVVFDPDSGRILYVGTTDVALDAVDADSLEDAQVIDAAGRFLMPGFHDPHVHIPEAGINELACFFPPGRTLEDYADIAAECNESTPDDAAWVEGVGAPLWELRGLDVNPLDVLDEAIPDRPAIIIDALGHSIWVNSLALEAAGITEDSPDPQGGIFDRQPDGRLNGLLLESAQHIVRTRAAEDGTPVGVIEPSLQTLARNGIVAVSDAGGFWAANHRSMWQQVHDAGGLTARAANTLYVYPEMERDRLLSGFERRFSDDDDVLRFDSAKIYVDGILDLGTALLLDGYDEPIDPDYPEGFSFFERDQLFDWVNELHQLGFRLNFHVIGDAATSLALDTIEAIDDTPDAIATRRHRLTHVYLVAPEDLPRFAELGVVADLQLNPDAIDPEYHEYLAERIGDRAFDLIPLRDLVDAGAPVVLSSDYDAGPLSPLGTIERALTRDNQSLEDLESVLRMTTIDAAWAIGLDEISGSIEVGKYADLVMLEDDLFEVDVDRIAFVDIAATWFAGQPVYDPTGLATG